MASVTAFPTARTGWQRPIEVHHYSDQADFRRSSDFESSHFEYKTCDDNYYQSKDVGIDRFAPAFVRSLEDGVVSYGDTKTLEVVLTGSPFPTVCWYKDGCLIDDRNIERAENAFRVYIIEAAASDAGVYSVEAANDYGETKCYARLFVTNDSLTSAGRVINSSTSAPRFLRHFSDTFALKGENVVFEATVAGSPKPTVQWMLNGVPIHNARYHYSNVDDIYTLVVSNCNVMDAGKFVIVAENHLGKASCSARLFVSEDTSRSFYGPLQGRQPISLRPQYESGQASAMHYHDDLSRSSRQASGHYGSSENRSHIHLTTKPLGYSARRSQSHEARKQRRGYSEDRQRRTAGLRISSDDDFLDYSDSNAEEVKRIHEFSRNVTERSFRERIPVVDDSILDEVNKRYRPVELIVGKHKGKRASQKQHHKTSRRGYVHSGDSLEKTHRHHRKRHIRLGSVPIGEHSRKFISSDEYSRYQGYNPVELILNKPKVRRVFTERQNVAAQDSMQFSRKYDDSVYSVQPKSRHSSTVVKHPTEQLGITEFCLEGEHEKRILSEAVGIESELELKIPKSRHSSQVYKQTREKPIVLNIAEPSVIIAGHESIRVHDKPLQVDEEILVKVKKTGGEHSSTVVREAVPGLCRINVPFPSKISGQHELRVVDDSVETESATEVKIPKPRTVHGDHSSTIMREQYDKKEQVVDLQVPQVIPGVMSERKYWKAIESQDVVDVKLPKQICRHSSTVVQNQSKDKTCFDLDVCTSIPGESDYKTVVVEPESTELILPKTESKHSSTVVCEKAEKVSLGKTRSFSGEHIYKVVEDSKADFSSTVMVGKSRKRGSKGGIYEINLASEVSEMEEEMEESVRQKQGHMVSWLSNVSQRHAGPLAEEGRHLTTVVKRQDTKEEIEMSLAQPIDTTEIVTRVGNYAQTDAIFLNGPSELIVEEEAQREETQVSQLAEWQLQSDRVEQGTSISIDTGVKREKIVGVQMSTSSSEVVAELKSSFEIKGTESQQVQSTDMQTSITLDVADAGKLYAPVEVNIPAVTLEPSKSVLVADVRAAYQSPMETLVANEQSSSQIVMSPGQSVGTYELNIGQPELEDSTSTVVADVKAHLSAQGQVNEYVQMEPSSSSVNIDLGAKPTHYKDIQLNLPNVTIENSRSQVIAQVESTLNTRNEAARSTVQPQSSYSLCMSNVSADEIRKSVDVRVRNVTVDDSKAEVVANLPGQTRSQLIGQAVCESSSSITVDTAHRPMEITMNVPESQPSSSTLITKTTHHGLASAEIKNFGRSDAEQFDIVLHQPHQSFRRESLKDKRHWEVSAGSSTIIKDIGFDDDSTDRYYLSDGELSSSTMQVDVGRYTERDYGYRSPGPRFISELHDVTVNEGERLVLSCQVEGAQRVEWLKDGIHPGSHCQLDFINGFLAQLTISEVFEEDNGLYTCVAISQSRKRNQTTSFVTVTLRQMDSSYYDHFVAGQTASVAMATRPVVMDSSGYAEYDRMTDQVQNGYEQSAKYQACEDSVHYQRSGTQGEPIAMDAVNGPGKALPVDSSRTTLQDARADLEVIAGAAQQSTHVDPFALFGARRASGKRLSNAGEAKAITDRARFLKPLPARLTKTEGSFTRLEVSLDGPVDKVQWKFNGQTLDERSDLRISSAANAHSLVIPRIGFNHAGTYGVVVKATDGQVLDSSCAIEVKEKRSRFDEGENAGNISTQIAAGRTEDMSSPGLTSSARTRDLRIRASKSPKPETRITVREGSTANSVFTFSETEDGQFVSVNSSPAQK